MCTESCIIFEPPEHATNIGSAQLLVGIAKGDDKSETQMHMAVTSLCLDRSRENQILGIFVWHLSSNVFTLKICPDRRKMAPNSPNIFKIGLRWACLGVALHVIDAAKPSQPCRYPFTTNT
jgi:hypothetical protein